jgi:carbon dioxide concentrating mechanism protein CcmN
MLTKFRSLSREVVPVHLDGNVSIDPTAAIAPGVLLQAEANSRITIGAGVCVGAGTIVHASGGNIDIGAGVCVGRGVLIVGSGSIERNACIGAGSTVMNPQIESGSVIPTHSIIGDRSRGEVSVVETPEAPIPPQDPAQADPTMPPDLWDTSDAWDSPTVAPPTVELPTVADPPWENTFQQPQHIPLCGGLTDDSDEIVAIEHRSNEYVAGRANFDRLKRQLFPNG